jgi:hypothetical protein
VENLLPHIAVAYKCGCVCENRECSLLSTGSLSQSFYSSHTSNSVITTAILLAAFVESDKIQDSSEIQASPYLRHGGPLAHQPLEVTQN